MLARYNAANGAALRRLVAKGTQLRVYSPQILTAAKAATAEYYEQAAQADSTFRQIYQQWQKFRTEVSQWNCVNEFSFAKFAFKENHLLEL